MPKQTTPAEYLEEIENFSDPVLVPKSLNMKGLTAAQWRKMLTGSRANNLADAIRDYIEASTPPGEAEGRPPALTLDEATDLADTIAREVTEFVANTLKTALRQRLLPLTKRR